MFKIVECYYCGYNVNENNICGYTYVYFRPLSSPLKIEHMMPKRDDTINKQYKCKKKHIKNMCTNNHECTM